MTDKFNTSALVFLDLIESKFKKMMEEEKDLQLVTFDLKRVMNFYKQVSTLNVSWSQDKLKYRSLGSLEVQEVPHKGDGASAFKVVVDMPYESEVFLSMVGDSESQEAETDKLLSYFKVYLLLSLQDKMPADTAFETKFEEVLTELGKTLKPKKEKVAEPAAGEESSEQAAPEESAAETTEAAEA